MKVPLLTELEHILSFTTFQSPYATRKSSLLESVLKKVQVSLRQLDRVPLVILKQN